MDKYLLPGQSSRNPRAVPTFRPRNISKPSRVPPLASIIKRLTTVLSTQLPNQQFPSALYEPSSFLTLDMFENNLMNSDFNVVGKKRNLLTYKGNDSL